jgi:hypothetical protein
MLRHGRWHELQTSFRLAKEFAELSERPLPPAEAFSEIAFSDCLSGRGSHMTCRQRLHSSGNQNFAQDTLKAQISVLSEI